MVTPVIFIGMGVEITVDTGKYPETLYFTEIQCTWSSERSYERNLRKINHNYIK